MGFFVNPPLEILFCMPPVHTLKFLVNSIPYGQYLRLKRNCSSEDNFNQEAQALRMRLLECGYSKKGLKRLSIALRPFFSKKAKTGLNAVNFITRSAQQHDQISAILSRHWWLFLQDPKRSPFLNNRPGTTYKRSRSLKDQLVNSHYNTDPCFSCCRSKGTFI